MENVISILQFIVAVIMIFLILSQAKGGGLGRTFGTTSSSFTKRGLERVIFKLTFVMAFLFIALSLALLII